MEKIEKLPPPPRVIASLQAGFNIVSGQIVLIIMPLLLDVCLWLGPRLSIGNWYARLFKNSLNILRENGLSSQDLAPYTTNGPQIIDFFNKLNWLVWLRTFPIGVPALMLGIPERVPMQTPLGQQMTIQLPSLLVLLCAFVIFTVTGWLAGGVYFRLVAGASLGKGEAGISLLRALGQTILLSVVWSLGGLIILVPIMLVLSLLNLISAALAEVVLLILLFLTLWLVVPLFFTPHGIFVRKQNAFVSIMNSVRLSRFMLPTSSIFVLSVFLLSRGLGYLWLVPSNDSWLTLVGIAGHAFISTTLLSASFIYYRDMNNWLEAVYERLQQINKRSSIDKA